MGDCTKLTAFVFITNCQGFHHVVRITGSRTKSFNASSRTCPRKEGAANRKKQNPTPEHYRFLKELKLTAIVEMARRLLYSTQQVIWQIPGLLFNDKVFSNRRYSIRHARSYSCKLIEDREFAWSSTRANTESNLHDKKVSERAWQMIYSTEARPT